MSALILNDPCSISALIQWHQAAGFAFRLPMHRAALAREIRLLEVAPGGSAPLRCLKPGSPLLVVLGDDGIAPTGPAGFVQTRRLLAWTNAVILHSCGGLEEHYHAAVAAARMEHRAILIETGTARREAWVEAIKDELVRRRDVGRKLLPVLDIRVRSGAPAHPRSAAA